MFTITWKNGKQDLTDVIAVRRSVFVDEQGFDASTEPDALDEYCLHAVLSADGRVIGTGRMYPDEGGVRIGRIAVLPDSRGMGYGDALMRALLYRARKMNVQSVIIHSQLDKAPFYARYGLKAAERIIEDGAWHVVMRADIGDIDLSGACCKKSGD